MAEKNVVFLSLGSNLGDRQENIETAVKALEELGEILKKSSVHETKPWGKTDQPDFLNIALKMKTALRPLEFLRKIQAIESELGRIRGEKWGPRTIDIDILLWNDEVIDLPELKVPHPHMTEREFVMRPLCEVLEITER